MRVEYALGLLPVKRVWMMEIADESDDEIIDVAMEYAGETRAKLFGWGIQRDDRDPTRAVVLLFTD